MMYDYRIYAATESYCANSPQLNTEETTSREGNRPAGKHCQEYLNLPENDPLEKSCQNLNLD